MDGVLKKVGRNDPCTCGSGAKYKRCCIDAPATVGSLARRLTFDFSRGTMEAELPGGRTVVQPVPPEHELPAREISRWTLDLPAGRLEIELPDGQIVAIDVTGTDDAPPPGIPIVYLDQNHWVALAQHEWAPHKLDEVRRRAAGTLIDLARSGQIILPLSSAHLGETMPIDGRRRRHLAGIMLELSRGWHMRSPVRVRHAELLAALVGSAPRARGVFTLEPHGMFVEDLERTRAPESASPDFGAVFTRMTAVSAVYSALIADERVDMSAGHATVSAWAAAHQRAATGLRGQGASKAAVREATHQHLIADLQSEAEFATANTPYSTDELVAWLATASAADFLAMPYLGRYEHVLLHRIANADDRWEGNDFNDMHALACAAGYADVVIGEKKMTGFLKRGASRLTTGAFVCRTLAQAAEHLAQMGSAATAAAAAPV